MNEANETRCDCNPCTGASCTCGCRKTETQQACACGTECACGDACTQKAAQ